MRRIFIMLVLLGTLGLTREAVADGAAPAGKVVKVLPLLLNLKGNDSLSPSLFDRNAYQLYLREHTNEISGVRYDVQWKASRSTATNAIIRVELRAVAPNGDPRLKTLEAAGMPGHFSNWASLSVTGDEYRNFGRIVAWRATLWSGGQLLGEQKSFLW